MNKTAYIGVGSNVGDKIATSLLAIERVEMIPGCRVLVCSDFFQTLPVGVEGQDWYVNSVISMETNLSGSQLLKHLLSIELDLKRKRERKWDPRTIDLDILLFGPDVIHQKDLTVPHPLMHLRKFVLVPMVQLAPELVHPVFGRTMRELLQEIPDNDQSVLPLEGV